MNCIQPKAPMTPATKGVYCSGCGTQLYWNSRESWAINLDDELARDIWDIRRLGFELPPGNTLYKLNFTHISQPWLQAAAKTFIKLSLSTLSASTARCRLNSLSKFSKFLTAHHPEITPEQISRTTLIDYFAYLASSGLQTSTRTHLIVDLRTFLDLCSQNKWLPVGTYLIRREDCPKPKTIIPRYIPDHVLQQLKTHLDDLAPPIMRMTLLLMECGMRISELIALTPDCLMQDNAGDWFLRYYQFKMKKEITIPVSREIVRVIQEQKAYIVEHVGEDYDYLFCTSFKGRRGFWPKPKPITGTTYADHLNRLAEKHMICDENGQLWHFRTHQFRHTVGTRMINNGVPQHIVQRYLGHESPEMTATYAHIHDQTMKEEISLFHGKVVNIAGQAVHTNTPQANDPDLQWFKQTIQAQALPNGSCALPIISKGCPHANACLTCTHFRTTTAHLNDHKQQLEATKQLIQKAQANGWSRQVEMNQTVQANLEAIIAGLEAPDNDSQA
ncbi:site-specific recombinase XerD [Leptolyngbya sp. PCC 7375]|nr:site-specific recombinase XerD [Leptolyngbya sp. PCC 7375]